MCSHTCVTHPHTLLQRLPTPISAMCPALGAAGFPTHSLFRSHPCKWRCSWSGFHLLPRYGYSWFSPLLAVSKLQMMMLEPNIISSIQLYVCQFLFQACICVLKMQLISDVDCSYTSINTAMIIHLLIPQYQNHAQYIWDTSGSSYLLLETDMFSITCGQC